MEFENNVYFGCCGRYGRFWRDVALSRIEVDNPTIIPYITFGIAFIVAVIFGVTKAKSAKIDYR